MNFFSKEFLFGVLSFFVLVLLVVLVYSVFWGPIAYYSYSLSPARTLSVSASDKITVKPDLALVSFSVIKEGLSIEKILEEGNRVINQAVEFAKSLGIEDKDIKTTEYNLTPVYSSPPQNMTQEFIPRIAKYSFTQTVTVKIRNFEKISPFLEKLPQLGINKLGNLIFAVDEPEKFLNQVRDNAFKKAREKAESIASQNGLRLGRIVYLSDNSGNYYPTFRASHESMFSPGLGGDFSTSPSVESGSQEISVNVNLVYEIR